MLGLSQTCVKSNAAKGDPVERGRQTPACPPLIVSYRKPDGLSKTESCAVHFTLAGVCPAALMVHDPQRPSIRYILHPYSSALNI